MAIPTAGVGDKNQDESPASQEALFRELQQLRQEMAQARETERELREQQRRLNEAQVIGRFGSFGSVLPQDDLTWSDELFRIFGLEPQSEPVTVQKFASFVHPEDRARFDEALQRFQTGPDKFDLVYRINRQDGQTRIVHTRAEVVPDPQTNQLRVYGTVQDITEQRLAQERLEASEALLRQAEAVGKIGSYEADPTTLTFRFSDEMFRILGYEPHSFTPTLEFVDSISHPDDGPKIRQQLAQALAERQPYHYLRRIYWPTGEMRYLEGKGRIVVDEEGQPVKFLGTVQDITQQVRTDLILDTINEVCFELDDQLRLKYANRKAYDTWKKAAEEVLGKPYFEIFPDHQDSGFAQAIRQAAQTRQQVLQKVYHKAQDQWFLCNAMPGPTGLIVLYFDVTDRVKSREQLRRQQLQFQALVENMPDLISRWKAGARLVYCNSRFEAKLGLEPGAGLGKTNLEMGIPPEVALPFTASLEEVFATGQPKDHTCDLQTPGGSLHLLARLVPELSQEGTVETVLAIAQDVTKIKQTEEENRKHHNILREAETLAGMGSWEYDIASDTLTWSEGLYRLFQKEPGLPVALGMHLEYVLEEDLPVVQRIVDRLRVNPQPFEETFRIKLGENVRVLKVKSTVVPNAAGSPAKVLGVDWDITEIHRLEKENLAIRLNQQKELVLTILNTQEEERRRIAEALHNGIAQLLYAAKLNLSQVALEEQIDENPQLRESITRVDLILAEAIQQTRSVSHELIPTPLSDLGLEAALKDICATLTNPHLKLDCWVFNLHTPLEKHLELAVYRIAQELANNIVKHAKATKAGLLLREQRGALVLEAEDNGQGFVPEQNFGKGMGLKSIHDRVKLLNGTIEIDSAPGQGTTVSIHLPLPKDK
ncbi:PAS domain-containing sensor histidine kinase [Rufibacter psychrotolerans]|uniref:PAS domain-containing sensor histidine kinase n=1 Tax=Rufibacter psychrotolerans TaxID=2812556 RepID=UPI0019676260|nr:PAS domain-containing protein [Rufibacter sp. SYSU D00308]